MRVTVITELTQPVRYVTQLTMVVTQLALTYWLWRALYAGVRVSAGLDVTQATSYALLGVLYLQFRSVDRWSNGDTMVQLMFEGTIAYWFIRPVSPRRWYLIRDVRRPGLRRRVGRGRVRWPAAPPAPSRARRRWRPGERRCSPWPSAW